MRKYVKRLIVGLALVLFLLIIEDKSIAYAANGEGNLQYQAHVENIGWQSKKSVGQTAGTTGSSKRMEAIRIWLNNAQGNSMVQYQTHIENIGWQSWKNSGEMAGTTGASKRMEAIRIRLIGTYAKEYDVWYRVHVQGKGWLGWTKNGSIAGSVGLTIRVEAIQIKLVSKGTYVSTGGSAVLLKPILSYRVHAENKGWMNTVSEGSTAGTTGQSLRLEGLTVFLKDFDGKNGIQYRAHVSNVGWQSYKSSSQLSGTTGQSKAIEAVQIKLSNSLSEFFDIYYRLHVRNKGWLGWAKNGASAGTTGGSLPAEAIQIKLVVKNERFNTNGQAYYDLSNQKNIENTLSWAYPMTNAYCTWRNSTNMSFGNRGDIKSRPYHCGIDIASRSGDANVYAASYGKVVYTGYTNGNGNHVIIQHTLSGKTIYTLYSHLNSICCKVGNWVKQGTKIGVYGNTGRSTGRHLHFAIFSGYCTDPYGYIPSISGNKGSYKGITFYNPVYVIANGRLS